MTPNQSLRDGQPTVLVQSRETGDVIPESSIRPKKVQALPFAKSWVHLMAGAYVPLRSSSLSEKQQDADRTAWAA